METIILTPGEMKAYRIMTMGESICTNEPLQRVVDKANELIILAEQIKAERARAALR